MEAYLIPTIVVTIIACIYFKYIYGESITACLLIGFLVAILADLLILIITGIISSSPSMREESPRTIEKYELVPVNHLSDTESYIKIDNSMFHYMYVDEDNFINSGRESTTTAKIVYIDAGTPYIEIAKYAQKSELRNKLLFNSMHKETTFYLPKNSLVTTN